MTGIYRGVVVEKDKKTNISKAEIAYHGVVGALECIPIVGSLIALVDAGVGSLAKKVGEFFNKNVDSSQETAGAAAPLVDGALEGPVFPQAAYENASNRVLGTVLEGDPILKILKKENLSVADKRKIYHISTLALNCLRAGDPDSQSKRIEIWNNLSKHLAEFFGRESFKTADPLTAAEINSAIEKGGDMKFRGDTVYTRK
jgi:hypothetical protein